MGRIQDKFFRSVKTFYILFLIVQLLVVHAVPVFAFNDTTNTWEFTAATSGEYTYDSNFVTIDNSGAYPVSGVNKLTNPDFASNNSAWSVAAVPPTGWVEVPGDATYSTTNFLVQKYEAKCAATSDPTTGLTTSANTYADSATTCTAANSRQVVSVSSGNPIVNISQTNAISRCSTISLNTTTAHLQTNNEWMSMARNAEGQNANWTNGTVGSGALFSGHNDNSPTYSLVASNDDTLGYTNTDQSSGGQKRTLTLSNGSVLWDLPGNVFEWTNDTTTDRANQPDSGTHVGSFNFTEFTALTGYGTLSYDTIRPANSSYNSTHGMGRLYHCDTCTSNATTYGFIRGGRWANGAATGVFTLFLGGPPSDETNGTGFRCASDPVDISQSFSSSSGRGSDGGNSVTIGSVANGKVYQEVNVGDTATYDFSVYVYDDTSGSEGGTVDATVASLFYNGSTISTEYTNIGSGWWKLTGTLTGANESREYGLQVATDKTIIMDDSTLSKQGDYSVYTTSAYSNNDVQSWDSFTATDSSPGDDLVKYQLCTDDGSTCESGSSWQYWTGSAWATATNTTTHSNTEAELTQAVMQALSTAATKISVKAILNFVGTDTPELDSFAIGLNTDAAAPTISLTALTPDPTSDSTPALTGTATDNIGLISSIEFQMDSTSGSWTGCTADDGAFDEISEAFTCTVSTVLSDGAHTMYVRAVDDSTNTTAPGSESSDTFTSDTAAPVSLDLESPGNNAYTNSKRPTFTWKATSDASEGMSKYVLEIDNPSLGSGNPSGDFTIDNIPVSRTTDYETNTYVIQYDNFDDSDSTNNYISVYTKSSSEWSTDSNSGQEDGMLREGIVRWKVKAIDNASNETTASRTLFVDSTTPKLTATYINGIPITANDFSTTKSSLTLYGEVTDPLAGGDPSQMQDENGPKIASGPKSIVIKVEKRVGLLYKLHTLYTINMDKSWYSCDDTEVTDTTKQKCDRYAPFEFTPEQNLDVGIYRVSVTAKDAAENSVETVLTATVTNTISQNSTPEEQEKFEEEIQKLPLEKQEQIRHELESTRPTEPTTSKNNSTSRGVQVAVKWVGDGVQLAFKTVGRTIGVVFNSIGDAYYSLAQNSPRVIKGGLLAIGNTFSGMQRGASNTIAATKSGIVSLAFSLGEKTQDVSDTAGLAIIKFTYNFVSEPTTISNVQVAILSPTSVKISWVTNHPANGKVNYGLDKTYPFDVQSEDRVGVHEFVLTDLQPDTTYQFEVMSHNKNYVYDANREFKTPPLEIENK